MGVCGAYSQVVAHAFGELSLQKWPVVPGQQQEWLRNELQRATKRLAEAAANVKVAADFQAVTSKMQPGSEVVHLRGMMRRTDHRCPDAQLWAGTLERAAAQLRPRA